MYLAKGHPPDTGQIASFSPTRWIQPVLTWNQNQMEQCALALWSGYGRVTLVWCLRSGPKNFVVQRDLQCRPNGILYTTQTIPEAIGY